jgi:hypothetical protein
MHTRVILIGLGLTILCAFARAGEVRAGWLTAIAGDAGAAAAAPATTAAGAHTYQFYLAAFGANYMTPAFTSSKDLQTLNADWRAHILQVHPASGYAQTGCSVVTSQDVTRNLQLGYKPFDWKE